MSFKVLEQNGIDNTNVDGARFNHFSAGQRSGVIKGSFNECSISYSGNIVIIATGELLISGFRIINETPYTFTFSSWPTSEVNYQIIAEIEVNSSLEVSVKIFLQSISNLITTNLFSNGIGRYQIELGRVKINSTGIINVSRTASLISGAVDTSSGSTWMTGELISGTGESIAIDKITIVQVNVNDYYLNKTTNNVYKCVAISDDFSYWDYLTNLKGQQGDNVYIRYSANPDGTDFTEDWVNSQNYLGIAVSQEAPIDKTGYSWVRFTRIDCISDELSIDINYSVADNVDKSFKASNISQLIINVPTNVYHGFCSGLNFKTGQVPPVVSFINNSSYTLKLMVLGFKVNTYAPSANKTVTMSIYCDGINVYCYINEVA